MRLENLIEMGMEYGILGLLVALVVVVVMIIWFIKHRDNPQYTKKYCLKRIVLTVSFVCYAIVILGVTLLDRGIMFEYGFTRKVQLFSSYIEAWNSFSFIEWRNLLLNIAMFMPLGFLLPILFDKLKKTWKTYIMGLVISLSIEIMQLTLGLGVFEFDDILNNTLGTMIGFGVYIFLNALVRKNKKISYIFLHQIPLILLVISLSCVTIVYNAKEFGNLTENYSYRVNMNNVVLSSECEFNSETKTVRTYKLKMGILEDTLNVAKEMFGYCNSKVDESQNDIYDATAIYYSEDRRYSVWVDYEGLTTQFTDFGNIGGEGKTGCDEKEIRKALEKFNVDIPNVATFDEIENGRYKFTVNMYLHNGILKDGTLLCVCSENGNIVEIDNRIITFEEYKEVEIISEKDAYEKIKEGKATNLLRCGSISIYSVELSYVVDSKGYYQPVYEFKCKKDSVEDIIIVPAMK